MTFAPTGSFLASNTIGTVAAAVTNLGKMTVVNSRITFRSNVVINGSYRSDPSTNTFPIGGYGFSPPFPGRSGGISTDCPVRVDS